ncbi:MAG: DUF1501 domain-containing protein [Actinobacteria bacterium]|nr:DUF1501 domain-containing protein [Actinomycetota bacterium]
MLERDISAADARRLLSRPDGDDCASERGPCGWTRRQFLQTIGMGLVGGAAVGSIAPAALGFDLPEAWAGTPLAPNDGVLINIVLFGGNDGLNTVVPYTNGTYYDRRGALAIAPGSVLPLDATWGLHPNLSYLKALWDIGWVGVIHGVGYPNPDLSHFTSMATWMHGSFGGGPPSSGWAGRWLDGQPAASAEMAVATIGWSVPLHLQGITRRGLGIPPNGDLFGAGSATYEQRLYNGMKQFSAAPAGRGQWHDMFATVLKSQLNVAAEVSPIFAPEPTGADFAQQMTIAARLVNANLGFRVVDLSLDGFDNHDGQPADHSALLSALDSGLAAFYRTLAPYWRNRVTIATMSEFGRTVYSNESQGTDHGTSSVQFVIGQMVRGGHYGSAPSLALPNRWDRLPHTVDFRNVLGTTLDGWLGGGASSILNGAYENLGFFHAGPGEPPPNNSVPPIIGTANAPTEFVSLTPLRVFDTRNGTGGRLGPLGANETWPFIFRGQFGVPADAVAVAINLTAVGASTPTFVTAWPSGQARPDTSNLNPVPGMAVPNLAVIRLGDTGGVNFFNFAGTVNLLADIVGYFREGTSVGLLPLTPARLLDTRNGTGGVLGRLGPGQTLDVMVAGNGGVSTDPQAVALNVTITGPTATSFLTVWPSGSSRPNTSSVNMVAGQTVPNMVISMVGANGKVSVFNAFGYTDVIVDVLGCFATEETGRYVALAPARVLDTRAGVGAPLARIGRTPLKVTLLGRGGVPADGVTGVLMNVTAVAPTADTFVTVYPGDSERPTASNLNLTTGQVAPNMVLARVGPDGTVMIYHNGGVVDLIADVVGYFTAD